MPSRILLCWIRIALAFGCVLGALIAHFAFGWTMLLIANLGLQVYVLHCTAEMS